MISHVKVTRPTTALPRSGKPHKHTLPADGLIALGILYVLWGSTYLGIKFALTSLPPFLLGGTRFPLGGLAMFVYLKLRGTPNPTPRQWLHCMLYGLLLIGFGNGLLAVAEQYISSGLAAAWLASLPLAIAIGAGAFGKWPAKLEWIGIGIGMLGVILLNVDAQLRASPLGLVALVIALVSWATGSILAKYMLDLPGGGMTTAIELTTGGLVQLSLSIALHEHLRPLTTQAIIGWVYLSAASIVGFTCYTIVLRRLQPALAASFSYVNPVVALALGAFLAGETVSASAMTGVAVIVAGVAFITFAQARR